MELSSQKAIQIPNSAVTRNQGVNSRTSCALSAEGLGAMTPRFRVTSKAKFSTAFCEESPIPLATFAAEALLMTL